MRRLCESKSDKVEEIQISICFARWHSNVAKLRRRRQEEPGATAAEIKRR